MWWLALAIACGPGGDTQGDDDTGDDTADTADTGDDTADTGDDTADCPDTAPEVTGLQLWITRPDGTCVQSPSRQSTTSTSTGAWSPDGQQIRYVSGGATWHVDRNGDSPVAALPGVISPDWQWVLSTTGGDDTPIVVRVTPAGGGDPDTAEIGIYSYTQGASWAPDGQRLQVEVEDIGSAYGDGPILFTKSLDLIKSYTGWFYEGMWMWSPDGSQLVGRYASTSDEVGIWIIPADGQDPLRASTVTGATRWLPQGDAVIVAAGFFADAPGLWRVAADGSSTTPLWTATDFVDLIAVSPDGHTVALAVGPSYDADPTAKKALVFHDLDGGPSYEVADVGGSGAFSPDGATFAGQAIEAATGNYQVYTVRPDGTGFQWLTDSPDASSGFVAWSPDSTRILWYGPKP